MLVRQTPQHSRRLDAYFWLVVHVDNNPINHLEDGTPALESRLSLTQTLNEGRPNVVQLLHPISNNGEGLLALAHNSV